MKQIFASIVLFLSVLSAQASVNGILSYNLDSELYPKLIVQLNSNATESYTLLDSDDQVANVENVVLDRENNTVFVTFYEISDCGVQISITGLSDAIGTYAL